MAIALRKVWRDVWDRKGRTLLVASSIAVGVMAVGMILSSNALITRQTTRAQAALAHLELRAPFVGTVAALKVKVGEQAAPGQPAATVADFSSWIVETDNLTEIEVVKIKEGQQTTVVLDALPDVTLQGQVIAISSLFEEKCGDITYTVKVALAERATCWPVGA